MTNLELLRKGGLCRPGEFAAYFAFSYHKAGSTLMHNMIQEVCASAEIPALNIPGVLFDEGVLDHEWQNDHEILEVVQDGRVYFGFRYLPELLLRPGVCLRERKSVLMVRDPRDALVSQYFSFGGRYHSHILPANNTGDFEKTWQWTSQFEIDEYVLNSAPLLLTKLRAYERLLGTDNMLLARYEDVYFDKQRFLGAIFSHFNLAVSPVIVERVARAHDIRPSSEDPTKHIRQGTPGDHRKKLRPETIAKLNDHFRDVCQGFGYDLDEAA